MAYLSPPTGSGRFLRATYRVSVLSPTPLYGAWAGRTFAAWVVPNGDGEAGVGRLLSVGDDFAIWLGIYRYLTNWIVNPVGMFTGGGRSARWADADTGTVLGQPIHLVARVWPRLVGDSFQETAEVFFNGIEIAPTQLYAVSSGGVGGSEGGATELQIGNDTASDRQGDLVAGHVAYWNRPLSDAQIATVYRRSALAVRAGLVSYYPLMGETGLRDLGPFRKRLTLTKGTTTAPWFTPQLFPHDALVRRALQRPVLPTPVAMQRLWPSSDVSNTGWGVVGL